MPYLASSEASAAHFSAPSPPKRTTKGKRKLAGETASPGLVLFYCYWLVTFFSLDILNTCPQIYKMSNYEDIQEPTQCADT